MKQQGAPPTQHEDKPPSSVRGPTVPPFIQPLFLISSFNGGKWQRNYSLGGVSFFSFLFPRLSAPYAPHRKGGNNRHLQRPIITTFFFFLLFPLVHFFVGSFLMEPTPQAPCDCRAAILKIISEAIEVFFVCSVCCERIEQEFVSHKRKKRKKGCRNKSNSYSSRCRVMPDVSEPTLLS